MILPTMTREQRETELAAEIKRNLVLAEVAACPKEVGGYAVPQGLDLADKAAIQPAPAVGFCSLQLFEWNTWQIAARASALKHDGQQVVTAIELGAGSHFDYMALLGPNGDGVLNYLGQVRDRFNVTFPEVSAHPIFMATFAPDNVIHDGFSDFLGARIWKKGDPRPKFEDRQARSLEEFERVCQGCQKAGIKHLNLFTGNLLVGMLSVQFPHPGEAELEAGRAVMIVVLKKMDEIALRYGLETVNIENHPEQPFHTTRELMLWAVICQENFVTIGCKFDPSHLLFTGQMPHMVVMKVTEHLRAHVKQKNIALLAIAVGNYEMAVKLYDKLVGRIVQRGQKLPDVITIPKDLLTEDEQKALQAALKAGYRGVPYRAFFRRRHMKGAGFFLSGVESTHERGGLGNEDGLRPNQFVGIHWNDIGMWGKLNVALYDHGMPVETPNIIEHENDGTLSLHPASVNPAHNDMLTAAWFCYMFCCNIKPSAGHQELMKGGHGSDVKLIKISASAIQAVG